MAATLTAFLAAALLVALVIQGHHNPWSRGWNMAEGLCQNVGTGDAATLGFTCQTRPYCRPRVDEHMVAVATGLRVCPACAAYAEVLKHARMAELAASGDWVDAEVITERPAPKAITAAPSETYPMPDLTSVAEREGAPR